MNCTSTSNQDSDDDGVSDGDEVLRNHTDPNYNPTRDPDKDGLESPYEIDAGLDPQNPDSDRDGLNDGDEVDKYKTGPLNQDTDNDGISDGDEVLRYHTNPLAASPKPAAEQPPAPQPKDSDGDGLSDSDELNVHPHRPESQGHRP